MSFEDKVEKVNMLLTVLQAKNLQHDIKYYEGK